MNHRLVAGVLLILALIFASALIFSSRPDPDAIPTVAEVSQRTMSPYCEGLLVSDCPSADSAKLRSRIAEKISSGWTNRRIDSWLVANYGEQILGKPRTVTSWLGPLIAIVGGLGVLTFFLRKWSTRKEPRTEPEVTEQDRLRVTAEVQQFARETTE